MTDVTNIAFITLRIGKTTEAGALGASGRTVDVTETEEVRGWRSWALEKGFMIFKFDSVVEIAYNVNDVVTYTIDKE